MGNKKNTAQPYKRTTVPQKQVIEEGVRNGKKTLSKSLAMLTKLILETPKTLKSSEMQNTILTKTKSFFTAKH